MVLRGAPHRDQKYRQLYIAEELVKEEMLTMLRHDLLHHPPSASIASKVTLAKVKSDLAATPLEGFSEEELEEVGGAVVLHFPFFCTCTCMYLLASVFCSLLGHCL